MSQFQSIIFDMDGMLRNISPVGIYEGWCAIRNEYGIAPDRAFTDVQSCLKWSSSDWHFRAEELGAPTSDKEKLYQIFTREYEKHIKLFDWVPDLISYLHQKGKILSVWTSSTEESVRRNLGVCVEYFTCIVGAETLGRLKPHPEGGERILSHTGILPERTVFLGDDLADYQAAKGCGIHMCPVLWGASGFKEIAEIPDYHTFFTHPRELYQLA